MALNRPPSDITPKHFFETWLPAEYAKLREQAGGTTPPDSTLQIALEGDGGGTWTITVRDGALAAKPEAAASPDAALSQTVQDWRALVVGEQDAPKLVPDSASPMDLLLLDPNKAKALEDVKGSLRFEVTAFNGRDWALEITLNGAAEPKSVISVDADTYQQMITGALPPPQAYFAGKIQIGGDPQFAMQLAMQLMANMNQ